MQYLGMKEQIMEFGIKARPIWIIERLIKSARERQLHDLLMDETGTVPAVEALKKAKFDGKSNYYR